MADWKILLTDGLEKSGQEILKKSAVVFDKKEISAEDLLKEAAEYDAIIVRGRTKVTAAVIEAATKLRVAGRAGVGVDNIDLNSAKAHGVTVVNSPIATTLAVAELTFGLMLSLIREIPRADAALKAGNWLKKELEGIELAGKTLGVIGFGRIGCNVAKFAKAFDMHIVAFDPLLDNDEITRRGGNPATFDELLQQADIITLHIPLTADSRNLINAEAIAKMKDGVRIVCAARGGVIDEEALLQGLESNKIAGVALDVFTAEPPGMTALVEHPRVIGTPHIGAQTAEAQERAAVDIATEVLAALESQPLRWKVA